MFLENNPLQILLDLLVPKHNLNYSSPSQYLTNSEISKIKKLEKETSLDLTNYSNGIYILKLIDENGIEKHSQKIIKE